MVEGLQRVVVTGLGAVTPIGNNVAEYWSGLTSGRNGVATISLFDASRHACRFAAEVKQFDPAGFIEPKDAKRWDRYCKFGVVAAKQALDDAGLMITEANAHNMAQALFFDVQLEDYMKGLGMSPDEELNLNMNRLKSLQKLYLFEQKGGENYLG